MPLSAFTTALLAVKDNSDLAKVLGFSNYSTLAHLVYPTSKYSTFTIKKKNGTDRKIHVPSKKLKDVQQQLLEAFDDLEDSRPSVHGFRKGHSVVTNAKQHSGLAKQYVFNIDLQDFFPSITFARVRGVFLTAPFTLPPRVATVLARICTYMGILPQGAPTSPSISNYICRGLDGRLQQLAKSNLATYSRYADDLTFSFTKKKRSLLPTEIVDTAPLIAVVGADLQKAIQDHGFSINTAKVRLRSRHTRMEVTGLTVNVFPNVQRRYIDEIRGMLNAWEKYGLKKAQERFESRAYKRQLRSGKKPPFENVVRGKLLYLKMVKDNPFDKVYNSLARRFNACLSSTPGCSVKQLPITDLALSEKDLEKAIFLVSSRNDDHNFEIKGTCFFLEKVGLITCDHVIKYPKNKKDDGTALHTYPDLLVDQYIGFPDGRIFLQDTLENDLCELEVVWTDLIGDVAVLRTKGASIEHLNIRGISSEMTSKEIMLVGFPAHNPGKSLSFAEGKIRSRFKRWAMQHYDITPLIRQGNSGGPVLDAMFQVIGVAKGGELQDVGNNAVLKLQEVQSLDAHYKSLYGPPTHGKPC